MPLLQTMERNSKIALLLATTMLFWMWQSSHPVFDKALPFLDISNGGFSIREALKDNDQLSGSSIILSVSEIIALYVGVATMASLYGLYSVCSDGKATFLQSVTFVGLVSLTSAGYGMHAVCVIIQLQMFPDNPLYSLLDFVHERWSHYMFQCGVFSLFLLVMWAEKPHLPPLSSRKGGRDQHSKMDAVAKPNQPPVLVSLWLKWLGPAIAGLFTAIFANRTETGGVALAFYISVAATFVYFVNHHKYSADIDVVSLINKYVTLGFFSIATLFGLPTLFIHAWMM